ncbi:hypothetical protein B0H13DRAFT_57110 [Mycena leptocephala]|nr:hypothetical protein B0H13DRAFT_57110 [Mycena leptocephala]
MLVALEADRTRVADIEAQILDLERSLSALQIEKALVQERLDSYKYPVLTLPNEITSEIFLHFLPMYPLCPPLTGILSPTLLTQICREWREIALVTPALWRAIALLLPSIPLERQARIAEIWLSRSGSCPLSIHIIDNGYEIGQAVLAAAAHRARWEHLKLHLLSPSSQLLTIEGPMPLLRHLNYTLDEVSNSPVIFAPHDVPLLRTVLLNDLTVANVVLPWAQLTSLVLHRVYPHECVPVLQQTSNLIHCELELFHRSPDHQLADIMLPYLESLTLKDPEDVPVTGYLQTLIVPTLRSLTVPESFLEPNPIDSLTSFISKSSCKLQQVRITGERTVTKNSYRRAFPSIPEFAFDGRYYNETAHDEDSEVENDSDSSDVETQ